MNVQQKQSIWKIFVHLLNCHRLLPCDYFEHCYCNTFNICFLKQQERKSNLRYIFINLNLLFSCTYVMSAAEGIEILSHTIQRSTSCHRAIRKYILSAKAFSDQSMIPTPDQVLFLSQYNLVCVLRGTHFFAFVQVQGKQVNVKLNGHDIFSFHQKHLQIATALRLSRQTVNCRILHFSTILINPHQTRDG